MRKLKQRNIKNLDKLFDGTTNITTLIENLATIQLKYDEDGYENVCIKREYYGYDGGNQINLIGYTLETDEELSKRTETEMKALIAAEKKLKAKEERERKKLEQLKEKYENK